MEYEDQTPYKDLVVELDKMNIMINYMNEIRWDDDALFTRFNAKHPDMAFADKEAQEKYHTDVSKQLSIQRVMLTLKIGRIKYICRLLRPRAAFVVELYNAREWGAKLTMTECVLLEEFEKFAQENATIGFFDADDATYLLDNLPSDMQKLGNAIRSILRIVGEAAYSGNLEDKIKRATEVTVKEMLEFE